MASFFNMNLNTKSKLYSGLFPFMRKKIIKAPANLRINNYLYFIQQLITFI
jgi:hypothetical protein